MPVVDVHTIEGEKDKWNLWFYCPGCRLPHRIFASLKGGGGTWVWNGSVDKPTVSPSLLCTSQYRCHLFLKNGILEFLNDCTHTHRGIKYTLPEIIKKDNKTVFGDITYEL